MRNCYCGIPECKPPGIHETAIIGAPAFAFDGEHRLPDTFAPEIDATAYIGPLTVVQNGNGRPTRLGARVKVDAGCHIGHDVQIAEDCAVTAHAILCGWVTLEANCYVGVGARVLPRLRVGRNAMIGAGAVVTRDVAPNVVCVGSPARFLRYRFPNEPETALLQWDGERWV